VPAATIGTVLLGAVALLVAAGLLRRDGVLAIVVGFTVVAFAFYALPTRVHERYLFPAFASGAVLASVALIGVAGYAVTGLLNAVNLHAVLAAPLGFAGGGPGRGPGPSGGGLRVPGGGFRGPVGGPGFDLGAVTSIHLPLADLARSPLVATAVALGQTAAMAGLVVAWLLVMNGAVASSFPWRVAGICMQREELPQVMCGSWCSRHLEREQATEDESLVQKSLAQIPKGRSSLEVP